MESLLVTMIFFWVISRFFKQGSQTKKSGSGQNRKMGFEGLETFLTQLEKGEWPGEAAKKEPKPDESRAEQAQVTMETTPTRTLGQASQRKWANPIGSLGGTVEGEDTCDPALGHVRPRMQSAFLETQAMKTQTMEAEPGLSFAINRETLIQNVVMSEVLMQPAWQKRRRIR